MSITQNTSTQHSNLDHMPQELDRVADRSAKKSFFRKRRGCHLCFEKKDLTYKDPDFLSKFTSQNGRVLSMKITNICRKHQKYLKNSIKISRIIGLMPFDNKGRQI